MIKLKLIILLMMVCSVGIARADEVGDACGFVLRKISAFKGGLYRQAPDTFEDEGKIYRGCVVIVVGNSDKVPDKSPPADKAYPEPGSGAAKAG